MSNNSLEQFIFALTSRPGVYCMLDKAGGVIYVGKAKNLKKRVTSYFQRQLDSKTQQMVRHIDSIQVTVTRNEREALLLESNLIKELKPKYNVIFRDDKSYPYLYLSTLDTFPRLSFYRGDRSLPGKYYGPYPNTRVAREALNFLQTLFKLRQCDDAFFKSRKRPCLQYQIKRCTAPCVNYIDSATYEIDVKRCLHFLEGKSQTLLKEFMEEMEKASENLNYERAAQLRDQIALLRKVQEQQIIMQAPHVECDVLGIYYLNGQACVQLLTIREGRMLGSRSFFPNIEAILQDVLVPEQELCQSFILQHYLSGLGDIPSEILVPAAFEGKEDIETLLSERAGRKISLNSNPRGVRNQWLTMAAVSAKEALQGRAIKRSSFEARFNALQEALQLEALPQRLECFDVSHTFGESTVASCVVFDSNGPLKSAYRRFNIRTTSKGDDYAALKEAISRRYTRLKSEEGILPDMLIIDGGKGQLSQAENVLRELQVPGVFLLGIAKGPSRKAGLETLYLSSRGSKIKLDKASPALHLIQQIRDEAHRFAITAHRKQRAKRKIHSRLEDVPGIGNARRIAILKRFGGLQEVERASVEELAKVPGIHLALAQRIYRVLHGD